MCLHAIIKGVGRTMTLRNFINHTAIAFAFVATSATMVAATAVPALAASEISIVVNNQPVTTFQIRQRAAFLKLRRVGGNTTQKATEELIDEELKKQEIRRRGIKIPDAAVEEAFGKFAADNKLTQAQLGEVLSRAGFSASAFKDYIRVQMGWGQAIQSKLRTSDKLSEQEIVQRMLAQGGKKPTTTEYTLQQIIFVIPDSQRKSLIGKRTSEANAMRARFRSCESTYDVAKSLRDVTVRDLGRVAQPELPPRWKDDIINTSVGRTTPARETERGVEFIAVCKSRNISDDIAAGMVFQSRDLKKLGEGGEPDAAFLKELKSKAQIIRR